MHSFPPDVTPPPTVCGLWRVSISVRLHYETIIPAYFLVQTIIKELIFSWESWVTTDLKAIIAPTLDVTQTSITIIPNRRVI